MNQELTDSDGNLLIFVGKKEGEPSENWIYSEYFIQNKINKFDENTQIITFGNPTININKEQKLVDIKKLIRTIELSFMGAI